MQGERPPGFLNNLTLTEIGIDEQTLYECIKNEGELPYEMRVNYRGDGKTCCLDASGQAAYPMNSLLNYAQSDEAFWAYSHIIISDNAKLTEQLISRYEHFVSPIRYPVVGRRVESKTRNIEILKWLIV